MKSIFELKTPPKMAQPISRKQSRLRWPQQFQRESSATPESVGFHIP